MNFPFSFWNSGVAEGTAYTKFNGGSGLIMPHSEDINFDWNSAFTISMWVYRSSSSALRILMGKSSGTTTPGWYILQRNETLRRISVRFVDSAGGTSEVFCTTPPTLGAWDHFMVSYNGGGPGNAGNFVWHVNGFEAGGTEASNGFNTALSAKNTEPLYIGNSPSHTGFFGRIDDIVIYSNKDLFPIGSGQYRTRHQNSRALVGVGLIKRHPVGLNRYIIPTYGQPTLYCRMGDRFTEGGGVLTYPIEGSLSNLTLTSTTLTSANISPVESKWSEYVTAQEKVEWKNFSVYSTAVDNWSQDVSKTGNDGTYTGYFQSTKKIVGNGKLHFVRNGTGNLQHNYFGISDENINITSPTQGTAQNRITFGLGNAALVVYSGSTIISSTSLTAQFSVTTLEVDGDNLRLKVNSSTVFSTTGMSSKFPNGYYCYGLMLYAETKDRWGRDLWYDFTGLTGGTLSTNNLI